MRNVNFLGRDLTPAFPSASMIVRPKSLALFSLALLVPAIAPVSAKAQDDPCRAVLAPLRARFAPDRRVAVFDVTCVRQGAQLVVKGDVDQDNARRDVVAALDAAKLGVLVDSIRVLPDPALADSPFGIVKVSVGNVRSNPAHSAELATQVMMGMVVKVLKKQGDWYYIQCPDRYLGWLEGAAMHLTRQTGVDAWQSGPRVIMTAYFGVVRTKPDTASLPVSDAVPGVLFKAGALQGKWRAVETPDGRKGFIERELVADYAKWKATRALTAKNVEQTAKRFIGVPYLWGGTSPKGMDCSGFTKTVFRLNGMELNRDANQQAQMGTDVSVGDDMRQLLKGDLLFFGQKASAERAERITHVGIWLQDKQIIHTPGGSVVRIDSFDPAAPNYNEGLVKSLVRARRIISPAQPATQP
jgi:cell wall-associated NlpC family hydrolase